MTGIIIILVTADHYIIICLDEMGSAVGPSATAQKRWISPTTLYSSCVSWATGFGLPSAPLQQTLVQTGTFPQYVLSG